MGPKAGEAAGRKHDCNECACGEYVYKKIGFKVNYSGVDMMSGVRENMILFSGYAKLPTGITASEMYKLIGVIVLVDINTGVIEEADCTLATALARRHVSDAIVGYDLNRGCEPLQQHLEKVYQGSAKKAVTTAIRIIYDKYRSYKTDGVHTAKE